NGSPLWAAQIPLLPLPVQSQNGRSPLSAAQISLPSSPAQSQNDGSLSLAAQIPSLLSSPAQSQKGSGLLNSGSLSPAQSIQEQPTPNHTTPRVTSQLVNAGGKVEERKRPTLEQSWEKMLMEVSKYDDGMVKAWKEDIDTLLGSLFSTVITSFVIESYQWLSEDPTDTTVMLLTQISIQLNASQITLPECPQFEPDASSICINCFWFLSLILSLISTLFGLLCKQWLREHQ
ncbi:hypothetical protein Moror_7046, partial [Moniliophthora roreri MCA 2997]